MLVLGARTDYGLFLVFRVRENLGGGLDRKQAVIAAVERVGESITFSAATVVAALLAVFGRAVFWPSKTQAGTGKAGVWDRVAVGPPQLLPPAPPAGAAVSPAAYQLYRAESMYVSPDGLTVQFETGLRAGDASTTAAMNAIPAVRATAAAVMRDIGARSQPSGDPCAAALRHGHADKIRRPEDDDQRRHRQAVSWPGPREICARRPCSTNEIGPVLSSRRGRAPPCAPLAAAPPLVAKGTGGTVLDLISTENNLYLDHPRCHDPQSGSPPMRGSARRERSSRVSCFRRPGALNGSIRGARTDVRPPATSTRCCSCPEVRSPAPHRARRPAAPRRDTRPVRDKNLFGPNGPGFPLPGS